MTDEIARKNLESKSKWWFEEVEEHETGKRYEHMVIHEKKAESYHDSSMGQTCEEGNTHNSSKND